ncbi:hypothetical protein HPB47_025266 [Ixodes persulcatus]|uniref:Uncharacterized protein n=1 Tax=Ixodes persulcatus TaxID=34615 RepID=A0AC60Q213_IXOPE|nr:hypothetical protein HPB47_025266 [Ixodes persulcatus]
MELRFLNSAICRSQLLEGWPTVWDSVTASPYTYDDECWVSYDDEASLRTKVDWAILQNLAGVFVWSVDQDDYRADCHGHTYALMRVIHKMTCLGCLPVTPERECKECEEWDVLDCTGQNCSYHFHETECSR